jgi:hypothetical protein
MEIHVRNNVVEPEEPSPKRNIPGWLASSLFLSYQFYFVNEIGISKFSENPE